MEDYLQKRIKELKKADADACKERWNPNNSKFKRDAYRELSNELTARRRELEEALKYWREN